MGMQKKTPFKAVVFEKSTLAVILYIVISVIIIFILTFIFSFMPDDSCVTKIMDSYFTSRRAYSEIAEIFTDERGRVNAIMEGYTMLVGKKDIPKTTPTPPPPSPSAAEQPRITQSTSTSLAELKNQSGKTVDTAALSKEPLIFKGKKPKVLIIHTHTTESYFEEDRSLDENKNMLAVGVVIKDALCEAGIDVIHDCTVHDYPSYSGAYTRSAATASKNLNENSGINIVLDVHRDAVATNDGSKLSLSADINGTKTAQLMFVVGTDAQLTHSNWKENLKLALKLQNCANVKYKGLMRPINLREQRFNQQLSTGSIILEVGTNGNTLEEAKQGAKLFSDVLIDVLSNNK